METRPTLISLAAGAHQVPLIRAARERGLCVVAIDRDSRAPGLALADHALLLSTHDDVAVIAALCDLHATHDLRGLVHRTSGRALLTAARIAGTFGLRGLTETTARIATEKSTLREFCEGVGIPVPHGTRARDAAAVEFAPPFIVKPDYPVVGKQDVRYVAAQTELGGAIRRAVASSANGLAEVEQYIDGIDVSCLFWLHGGLAHPLATYDELIGVAADGSLVPFGIHMPSILSGNTRGAAIESITNRLAARLPEVSALMIASLRIDAAGKPHLIELHADLGGDRIAEDLFPRAAPGLDFFDLAVRLAVGEDLPPRADQDSGSHLLLYASHAEEGVHREQVTEIFSAPNPTTNLDRLARRVARSPTPLAIPPAHLSTWGRECVTS